MSNFHSKQKGTQVHNPKRFEEASDNSLLAKIDGRVSYLTTNHQHTTTLTPVADSSGSLNNKSFIIYTSNNTQKILVVFNVGGLMNLITPDGIDKRINIAIDTNDTVASIIDDIVTSLTANSDNTHTIFKTLTDNTTSLTLVSEANSLPEDVDTGFTFATSTAQNNAEEYLVSEATTGKLVFKSAADGIGDKFFQHTQTEASATWVVNHNMTKFPSVTVVDSAGTVVIGKVTYNSTSQATLSFVSAFSGSAYFN